MTDPSNILNKHMFILHVLEITSCAYVYFPTMRLHFSTRKRKHACPNNDLRLVLNYILRQYCIIVPRSADLLQMTKGLLSGTDY